MEGCVYRGSQGNWFLRVLNYLKSLQGYKSYSSPVLLNSGMSIRGTILSLPPNAGSLSQFYKILEEGYCYPYIGSNLFLTDKEFSVGKYMWVYFVSLFWKQYYIKGKWYFLHRCMLALLMEYLWCLLVPLVTEYNRDLFMFDGKATLV